ncbi:MAG: LysR substrate-binding domain-containing protein [Propionibacteriaceae bacterium]|nr:LysR family transcriptional regulator [Micropruina sp.]HBX79879.1 LysR family transcriptional regulator [Propionibacteriaceae bacterium]HBY22858.1 LysR family transcriptional regulator [Propionibacteriaceae bacterium]
MSTTPVTPRPHLRVGYVPGVTLTKWRTVWSDRFPRIPLEIVEVEQPDQRQVLVDEVVDVCFVRLPLDTDGLHRIPLYEELPVAWVSKDHVVAAVDEVSLGDLADEDVRTEVTTFHVDLVALGEAVLHVPMSIARTQSRRDLVYRPITDAPSTTIAIAWRQDDGNELIEEFIGVVRGRTANSSRTAQARGKRKS